MKLSFFGATRQVTGSCYFLEAGGLRILIDCGMFQERAFLDRNWSSLPAPVESIDLMLLTHAHLDHSGLIPKLVRDGFTNPIRTTAASRDLAEIILEDSAHIQEEDVAYKKRRHERERRRGPHPEVPLYTSHDVRSTLPLFETVAYNDPINLNGSVRVTFHDAGHILGSAMIEVVVRLGRDSRTILFSGDIGRWKKPMLHDPTQFAEADYVVMESTYGDRDHPDHGAIEDQLCEVINATVDRGGNIVIPTFAVERAQELMYHLARLAEQDRIPHLMAFLDSPMAVDVTEVFRNHRNTMDEEARKVLDAGERLFQFPGLKLVRHVHDSKAINRIRGSCIIMAGSGMCTAGRIKHHLVNNISRPESTIVFVGYQAAGTLGRHLVDGAKSVRIHGSPRAVQAQIAQIHGLSAHADRGELLRWLSSLNHPPRRVFLTHGEAPVAEHLAGRIRSDFGWTVDVPAFHDEVRLD